MQEITKYYIQGLCLISLSSQALYGASLSLSLDRTTTSTELNSTDISVVGGSATYQLDSIASSPSAVVPIGDGTVEDYAFYNASDAYAEGSANIISGYTSSSSPSVGNHSSLNLTTATSTFTSDTGATAASVTGSIDLSSFTSGTVYIFFGSFGNQTVTLDASLSGTGLMDITQSTGVVTGAANGSRDRYAVAVDFVADSGYDTLSYSYSHNDSDGSRSRFYGVAVDAIPEPSSTSLFGLGALAMVLRRRR